MLKGVDRNPFPSLDLIATAISFIGDGIASMTLLGLMISIFDLTYQSALAGTVIGGSFESLIGFFSPGLLVKIRVLSSYLRA